MQESVNLEHPRRLATLRREMASAGVDCVVGTRQATLSYIGGALMPWRSAVVVTADDLAVLTWEHDSERVRDEVPWNRVDAYSRDEGFVAGLLRVLDDLDSRQGAVGLEIGPPQTAQLPPGAVTAAEYAWLVDELGASQLKDVLDLTDRVMLLKSEEEVHALRKAAQIAEHGISRALEQLEPGTLETHIAGVIEGEARFAGNEWTWSVTAGTEVAAGARTAYLGGVTQPSMRRAITNGDNVILDAHTMYDLYLADVAANAIMGQASPDQQNLHDAWKQALDVLLKEIAPGKRICDVTQKAYKVFDRYGLDDVKVPLFGHGLGTCARTPPRLTLTNTAPFEEGMVMALGVHLYQPGVGGMRTEQPLVVAASGAEPLCDVALDWHVVDC